MRAEIIVFGRPPVPGTVKTRLARAIGPVASAEVYRELLDHVLAEACATGFPVTLALTHLPSGASTWRPPADVGVVLQASGDLGARMRRAFDDRFDSGAEAVVLVGSDLPALSADLLRQAAAALSRTAVVLGPSVDGGYWLVGQWAPGYDLFSGVPWSAPDTLAATRRRLSALALEHEELVPLRDLDAVADLDAALVDEEVDQALRGRLSAVTRRRAGDTEVADPSRIAACTAASTDGSGRKAAQRITDSGDHAEGGRP